MPARSPNSQSAPRTKKVMKKATAWLSVSALINRPMATAAQLNSTMPK